LSWILEFSLFKELYQLIFFWSQNSKEI